MAEDKDYIEEDYDEEEEASEEGEQQPPKELQPPAILNYPFQLLRQYFEKEIIDLEPTYQRDVVWNDVKQGHLIDSLVKNYYVPPVIFSKKEEGPDGKRAVIDGKQRLTSIYKFMKNLIPHIDSTTKKKRWYAAGSEGRKSCFTAAERTEFNSKTIICIEYSGLSDQDEEEMFNRVQMGMPLSAAEKMYATGSPLGLYLRVLLKEFDRTIQMIDDRRKRGFQVLAQAYCIVMWKGPELLPSTAKIQAELKKPGEVSEGRRRLFTNILRVLRQTYEDYPHIFGKEKYKTVAPIEFAMFCYLIYKKKEYQIHELKEAIETLRDKTRKKEKDIRANQRLYSYMREVIEKET
ncbi:hypothetical protein HK097_008602 [Rhizophlyctis rosea]|uniref:GmrSD restriction endonucleases N-terminal domain-containing protein n=1 Tax=Rhizophlyctis rosea TaxID=64517 RepID=A0AAD5SC88_9FUNG|nr:hypothetical protein HK097_008602 [Rhizophlyctis rosea]